MGDPLDERFLVPLVALALVVAAVPATAYRWQNAPVPPQETGLGRNDVRDEPNHPTDTQDPGNGFGSCGSLGGSGDATSCQDSGGTLVLEAYYEVNLGSANADVNNLLRAVAAEVAPGTHEDRIYPGLGYFGAYWGWWQDKGSGGSFQDESVPGTAANPLASGDSNGAIDDAHDDTSEWEDSPHDGIWDEFVWRGDNPWAPDHSRPSEPGDTMHLFVQPGTWHNVIFQFPYPPPIWELDCCGYLLRDDHDSGSVPDMEYSDRTGKDLDVEDQGWVTGAGFPHINYDASLLVTTEATTAVNAPAVGGGARDISAGEAADVDIYSTVDPVIADLYRQTVWDPGDRDEGSDDSGPKDTLKDEYTTFALRSEDQMAEWQDQATRPASPLQGAVQDAAGDRVRPHEPNTPGDAYPGATHDSNTSYGALAGGGSDYYEPGPDQTYDGYRSGEEAFLDIRPGFGVPVFPAQRYSFNVAPAPNLDAPFDQGQQRTASPGFLSFRGNFGTWWDTTDDTFVGNLAEFGRSTSQQAPYRNGTVDDPNDYGDHAQNHEGNPSKAFQWTPEWRGLCGGGDVDIEIVPDNPQERWGATGVYVLRDDQGGSNPYDDVVDDALDDRSRHVTEGPIDIGISCDSQNAREGEWLGEDYVFVPAGNPTFTVEVTSVGTVLEDREDRSGSGSLQDDTVTDVDHVHAWS